MTDIKERLQATFEAWNNPPGHELPDGAGVLLEAVSRIEELEKGLEPFVKRILLLEHEVPDHLAVQTQRGLVVVRVGWCYEAKRLLPNVTLSDVAT